MSENIGNTSPQLGYNKLTAGVLAGVASIPAVNVIDTVMRFNFPAWLESLITVVIGGIVFYLRRETIYYERSSKF